MHITYLLKQSSSFTHKNVEKMKKLHLKVNIGVMWFVPTKQLTFTLLFLWVKIIYSDIDLSQSISKHREEHCIDYIVSLLNY